MRRSPLTAGVVLVLGGLLLYWFQDSADTRVLMFWLIGGAFITAFVYERQYGYLVPGGILFGIGTGLAAETWLTLPVSEPVPLGLGLGFLLIYVLDQVVTREGGWWPLVPGGVLTLVGIGKRSEFGRWVFEDGWPLVIVAAGVVLILRGLSGGGTSTHEQPD